jgi:hypothetical protein
MCTTPVIVSVATEVDASCDRVWEVISDIESAPLVISSVVSVERLSDSDKKVFKEGTRWKEIRTYEGKHVTQIKTVTSIRKESGGYAVGINVGYPAQYKDYTNTSTLEIRPLGGQKGKCLLIGSFGIMPGDWKSRIVFCLLGRRIAKQGERPFLAELNEIAVAATRKEKSGRVNNLAENGQ